MDHFLPATIKSDNWFIRGQLISKQIRSWMITHEALDVAIEEPIYSWGRRNPKGFAKQNILMGLILGTLSNDSKIWLVNPKSMKLYFTRDGNADKEAIIARASRHYNLSATHIKRKPNREAIADAIGIAYVCYRYRLNKGNVKGVTLLG